MNPPTAACVAAPVRWRAVPRVPFCRNESAPARRPVCRGAPRGPVPPGTPPARLLVERQEAGPVDPGDHPAARPLRGGRHHVGQARQRVDGRQGADSALSSRAWDSSSAMPTAQGPKLTLTPGCPDRATARTTRRGRHWRHHRPSSYPPHTDAIDEVLRKKSSWRSAAASLRCQAPQTFRRTPDRPRHPPGWSAGGVDLARGVHDAGQWR